MKKTLIALSLVVAFASSLAFGQTILTNTTLSVAQTSASARTFVLTSATGVTAPSPTNYQLHTFLYVDRELLDVTAVNGTTITTVRGAEGTAASTHASGAVVFVIPAYLATYLGAGRPSPATPAGSCTRGNELVLPRINFTSGIISDCNGGQWVNGIATQTTLTTGIIQNPPTGGTLYTALETNGTAAGATTEMYCTEIRMPYSKLLTGLKILNGTTVGTDLHNVELYDAGGKLLANSAAAGAVTAGASTYQAYAFTTPFYAVGPAKYFGCFTANGTTDTVRHLVTSADQGLLAGKITGLTYGTISSSITPPSTFTTALGAYLQLY
jgi:hypothetical protein